MSIKRRVRVTIEKEFDVELTDKMFGDMCREGYITNFCECLWEIDGIDDVVKYAARMVADGGVGYSYDGLGIIRYAGPNVKAGVLISNMDEDMEVDIIKEYP